MLTAAQGSCHVGDLYLRPITVAQHQMMVVGHISQTIQGAAHINIRRFIIIRSPVKRCLRVSNLEVPLSRRPSQTDNLVRLMAASGSALAD